MRAMAKSSAHAMTPMRTADGRKWIEFGGNPHQANGGFCLSNSKRWAKVPIAYNQLILYTSQKMTTTDIATFGIEMLP
jgi:hypothetical protein